MLRPSDRYRPTISGHNIYQQRKPRQPHGPNAIQPIANSGLPGTAGIQSPKQVSQPYVGISNNQTAQSTSNVPDYYGMGQKANTVAAGAAQGFSQRGQAALNDAQQYYDSTRQLQNVGTPDYTDYNSKTAAANARNAESNARLNATNERIGQQIVDDQKYYDAYGPNGYYVAKDAKGINALASAEQAKKDAFNAQYDAKLANSRAAQQKIYGNYENKLGVHDMSATTKDLGSLSAEFANFQKAGGGMKFVDFIQAKIDRGEIPYKDDSLKVIASNYGHEFRPQRLQLDGEPVGDQERLYNRGQELVAAQRELDADYRAAGYKPGMSAAQRDGLDRRRAQAAKQATDSSAIAYNVAHGIDPYTARQMVAADNAKQDWYGQQRAMKQDEYDAQLQAEAMRAQADIYRADRQYEASKAKSDPYQSAPDSQLANDIKKAGDIDLSSVTAPATIIKRAQERGLSPSETVGALSKSFGVDLTNPQNAADTLHNIAADMRDRIAQTQTTEAWNGEGGWDQAAIDREWHRQLAQHLPTIRLLRDMIPPEDFAALWNAGPDERVDLRGVLEALDSQ